MIIVRKGNPISVRPSSNMKIERSFSSVRRNFLFQLIGKRRLITVLLLICLMIFFYILSREISFFESVLYKIAGLLGGKALSFIFLKLGCPATLAFVLGCAFRALVTTEASPSLSHCVLPGPSHQPDVSEEFPNHVCAIRSAPPVDIEVKQPLMGDEQRHQELSDRLNRHFFGHSEQINSIENDDLLEKQILIERKLEITLLSDGYSRERILANRYEIRELIFYKEGSPLKEKTLDLYLKQIQSSPFQNTPYRKISKSIKNFDIFFSK